MKIPLAMLLVALPVVGIGGLGDSLPTAQNSVPVSMEIHFFSSAGKEFRLYRAEGFITRDGICRQETVTRYEIDHSFDENAKEVELSVSGDDWMRFRQALRDVGFEKMKKRTSEAIPIETAAWSVRLKYPDVEIDVQEANSPDFEVRFAKLRNAIFALTKGKWNSFRFEVRQVTAAKDGQ